MPFGGQQVFLRTSCQVVYLFKGDRGVRGANNNHRRSGSRVPISITFKKMHKPHRGRTHHEERERDHEYNEMRLEGVKIPIEDDVDINNGKPSQFRTRKCV